MDNRDLLEELESLVDAVGQCFALMSGTLSRLHGADAVLRQVLEAKGALEQHHGPNPWRDRLIRDMVRIVAIQARPAAANDEALQTLVSSVLEAPVGSFQKN